MALINPAPNNGAMTDQSGDALPSWVQWFQQVYGLCFDVQNSGTTAQRPTKFLYAGKPYFDSTLGKPIWYKTAGWVDATGAAV